MAKSRILWASFTRDPQDKRVLSVDADPPLAYTAYNNSKKHYFLDLLSLHAGVNF